MIRPWQWSLSGVSVVGTLVTVFLAPDHPLKTFAIWTLLLFVVAPMGWSLLSVVAACLRARPFKVVNTRTDAHFDEAWHLGDAIYTGIGRHYPPEDLVRQWWLQYQGGVLRLCDRKDELWGYLSIWPISRKVFLELKTGGMPEEKLEGRHIEPKGNAPFHYWYAADICRRKRPPGTPIEFSEYVVKFLIGGGLRVLLKENDFAENVELIAFAATIPGEKLLKKLGFIKVQPTAHSPAVTRIYVKAFTKRSLGEMLRQCDAMTAKNESAARHVLGM